MAIILKSVLLLACLGVFMLVVAGSGEFIVKGNDDVDATFNEHPGEVVLAAAEEIRLLPGFHAREGSKFRAFIDPSISCNTGPVMSIARSEAAHNNLRSGSDTKCEGAVFSAWVGAAYWSASARAQVVWASGPNLDTLIIRDGDTAIIEGESLGCSISEFWWYRNDTLLSHGNPSGPVRYIATSEGAYRCYILNEMGSPRYGTIVILFENATGINDKANLTSVVVFPNPSPSLFGIHIASSGDIITAVQVADVMGRIVYSSPLDADLRDQTLSVDLSGRPEGIYLITVFSGNRPLAWRKLVLVR